MKKGFILAVSMVLAAALAGCELQAVIPAFLLPSGFFDGVTPQPQETAAPVESAAPSPDATAAGQTAAPEQTATPAPNETPPAENEPYPVLQRYESAVPAGLAVTLRYDNYATPMNYFVALKSGSVYAQPDAKSKKLHAFSLGARLALDKLVQGPDGKSRWFHVTWTEKNGAHEGYVKESAGRGRSFRLAMMLERVQRLQAEADKPGTVFIVNYKNRKGQAPALPGAPNEDSAGYRRDQSAPAYAAPDAKSAFRYAPDGMMGTALEKTGGYTKIWFPTLNEARWVPDKFVSKQEDAITSLTQVIIVDRAHQNSAAFEYADGMWKLISMTYVSTGKTGGYSLKTPLGDFMGQDRVSKFYYYKDGTKVLDGYAPYAVRFSGGGYLHGVPRQFRFDAAGKRIDPGHAEALRTLGTTPQSHMCVRNYTSYAKFVYDWFLKGQCAVIVIE